MRQWFGDTEWKEDRRLARRLLAGDEEALKQFMETFFPRLYRFALHKSGGDGMLAEEAVQDTLIIAARRIETYRGEASLAAWLTRICEREVTRMLRKRTRREHVIHLYEDETLLAAVASLSEAEQADEPEQLAERAELARLVHFVLDHLPSRYGDVLELKYIDGLSLTEIAERLDLGHEAVQSLLARARRAFKKAFGDTRALVERPSAAPGDMT